MKKSLLFVIILIISTLACTVSKITPTPTPTETKIPTQTATCTETPVALTVKIQVNVDVGLHIRGDSNEHAEDLGVIPDGAEIELVGKETENGWICVIWNGIRGWVNADYLELPEDYKYQVTPTP